MTKKIFVLVLFLTLALSGCSARTVDTNQAKSTPVVAAITAYPTPIVVQTKDREIPRASRSSSRPTPVAPVEKPIKKPVVNRTPKVVKRVASKPHVIANKPYVSPGGAAACIRHWESRGNYRAVNPSSGASGAYQFLDSTWTYVTGLPGKAMNYPPAVQDAAFWKLWDSGKNASQWVTGFHCI